MEIKDGGEGWWDYWGKHRTTGSICMRSVLMPYDTHSRHRGQGTSATRIREHTDRVSQLPKRDKNLSGVRFKTELPVT